MSGRVRHSPTYKAWRKMRKNRLAMVSLVLISLFIAMAVLAPLISPHDPAEQTLSESKKGPCKKYLRGTDKFGRDILSRIFYGAQISLSVGFVSQGIALLIGITVGALGGYFGGKTDAVCMWLINVVWSFPYLLFVIAK